MRIYLIRHGETEANIKHLYCGSTDIGLSEQGKAELCKLNYAISGTKYVTSGMKRANETLYLLFGDVPFEAEPRFREVDFGIFEMQSYEQLKDRSDYQQWISGNNERNIPPQGESGEQMKKRVLEAFTQVEDGTVVITHGGVIAAIMEHLFPQEGKNRYQWQPKPGRGYVIRQDGYEQIP